MKTETYVEQQERIKTEQEGMTKEEVMDRIPGEYKLDLDNLPRQAHNWIKRGIKVSCEGADHPHHSHFLMKR